MATSGCDAWAVGYRSNNGSNYTLVEHWNGKAWKVQKSPNPSTGGVNVLYGVAAVSASDAWAVGYDFRDGAIQTLVEHWNGKAWKVQKSPDPSTTENGLTRVVAVSARDAWAVGYYYHRGSVARTLVERWNGKAWTVQKSADPSTSYNSLSGVVAVSASDAWAVGYYEDSARNEQTLIEHWNGKAWKVQNSPDPSTTTNELYGAAAVAASNAWAVGYYSKNGSNHTLVEHWDGKAWKVQKSPNGAGSASYNGLLGVAAVSASNAWAVGSYSNGTTFGTLVEHWDGKVWKVQKSPNPGGSAGMPELVGVAAVTPSDAWAVGTYSKSAVPQTLIEHWNGKDWKG